jgi:methyl-accepting chemotaxis protein
MILIIALAAISNFVGDRWIRHLFSGAILEERAASLELAADIYRKATPDITSASGRPLHLAWDAATGRLLPSNEGFRLDWLPPQARAMVEAGATARGVAQMPGGRAPFFAQPIGETGALLVATRLDPGFGDYFEQFMLYLGAVTIPMTLFVLVTAILLVGAGFKSLTALQTSIDAIAAGKLDTATLYVERNDATGKLARSIDALRLQLVGKQQVEMEKAERDAAKLAQSARLETLTEQLRGIVSRSVAIIAQTAGKVKDNSAQTLEAARSTINAMDKAKRASEQAMESTLAASAVTEQLRNSSHSISEKALNSAELTTIAAQKLNVSSERIAELNSFSVTIDEVIALIGGIADQTKLLALNATIEAARAGAAGRGFSVVAQEVNALSAQTTKATEVIRQQIAAIQATTGAVVTQMDSVSTAVADAKHVADFLGHAVHEHAEASESIAHAILRAANVTTTLEALIATVDEAANHTTGLSSSVQQAVENLLREADDLKSAIDTTMADIRAA